MQNKPTILETKIVAKTRLFELEQLRLKFSNGEQRHFERLVTRTRGAVMIIPMLDAETILLIREYGAGIDDYYLAFPKGIIENGESDLEAANRELKEEIGYGAKQLDLLKSTAISPGYMSNNMSLILARDLYPEKLIGDEPEPIEVVPWQLADYQKLLDRDDFCEARSIAALLMIKNM